MATPKSTVDSKEAYAYLIDPLIAPDPSDETGPNAHFRSTFAPASSLPPTPRSANRVSNTNPYRSASVRSARRDPPAYKAEPILQDRSYPTPPHSASPRRDVFSSNYRREAFGEYTPEPRRRRNSEHSARGSDPSRTTRSRGNSLGERFPGDKSHQPLNMLTKEAKAANRSHHLRKNHQPGADVIDKLDDSGTGIAYHHGGPYDAALPSRNTNWESSPVAAVTESNMEALKATPKERIKDSLTKHVPLIGTAEVAPGKRDRMGQKYDYEEGDNMMIVDGGNYKRWPGVDYLPEDVKGKGEPTYSIEKALKEPNGDNDSHVYDGPEGSHMGDTTGLRRHESLGKRAAEGIKRRIGSLRRKEK